MKSYGFCGNHFYARLRIRVGVQMSEVVAVDAMSLVISWYNF